MSRKFEHQKDDIETVWNAVRKFNMKRKQICELMNCTPEVADQLYEAGQRRFGKMQKRAAFKISAEQAGTETGFERPKAVYSNPSYV